MRKARVVSRDPLVMLHAPLRTLLYADRDGDTKLAVDQPSLLFASYDDPQIVGVGRELDALLARSITLLGGDPPAQLAATISPAPTERAAGRLAGADVPGGNDR